jgi:hypothetical protein
MYYSLISSMLKTTVSTLLTGLYAIYKGESNANDSLGTYNGTPIGGLTYSAGKSGNAFLFNGVSAYNALPDNMFNTLTSDFTISLWLYHTVSGAQSIIGTDFYQTIPINIYKGWRIEIDNLSGSTNKLGFIIAKGTTTGYTGWEFNTSLTQNTWNHIVLTRVNNTETYCWINNSLSTYTLRGLSADITFNPIYHTTQYCSIGADKYSSALVTNYMKSGSKLDEINIWNRQLTLTERNELYNTGTGKFYPY